MAVVVEALTVDRPVATVWATLANFADISRWAPNVDHSCLTSDREGGVGAIRRVQSGRVALLETVTVWEPEQLLGYSISGLPSVIRSVTNTWSLRASGSTTDVTLTSEVDAGPRPPQQVVARVAGRALAKASRQMLDGLAEYTPATSDPRVAT